MNIIISKITLLLLILTTSFQSYAQKNSPYTTDFYKDGAWIVAGLGATAAGIIIAENKDELTSVELSEKTKDDIWKLDRWAAGNYNESSNKISDIPFYLSFATPLLFGLNEDTRDNAGQIGVMYIESLSTTAALFNITSGLINKSRPLVYNNSGEVDFDERVEANSQRSFYSGHVAASAAATFFAAQVFSDFFPNSNAKPFVWAGAATIPAVIAYLRIDAGKHFLSDTLVGYAMGALSGIIIPRLHRKSSKNFKVSVGATDDAQTIGFSYKFR